MIHDVYTTGGVHFTDPLLFTCELYEVFLLRVVLPTGDMEQMSIGDNADDVVLPAGFKAVSLNIIELETFTRNIGLTFSIANASLLDGGNIICDNSNGKAVMAGCLIDSKLINILINLSDKSKCNHPTCPFYNRPPCDT